MPAGFPVVVILMRASRGQAKGLVNKQEDWANMMMMRRQNWKKKKSGKWQLEKPKNQDVIITRTEEEGK